MCIESQFMPFLNYVYYLLNYILGLRLKSTMNGYYKHMAVSVVSFFFYYIVFPCQIYWFEQHDSSDVDKRVLERYPSFPNDNQANADTPIEFINQYFFFIFESIVIAKPVEITAITSLIVLIHRVCL